MKLVMENWKRFLKESRDEYPEDEAPDEDDDGALRPRERDRLRSDVFKAIDDLTPGEEVEVDLDESMSAYDLGAELRSIQMDTMHAAGPGEGQHAVIRMMDVVNIYGDTIEKAAKALDSLGEDDLAMALRAQLERAKRAVSDAESEGKRPMVMYDEPEGAEKFYAIFDAAGDALLRAKSSEE
jgi:hypothetical protein